MPRSASSSSTSRLGEPVTQVATNRDRDHIGGKRNPAKLDFDADSRRERGHIDQACLILLPIDPTGPRGGAIRGP